MDIVQLLIDQGGDVKIRDNQGMDALMWRSYKGHSDIAGLLLSKGAEVNGR